MKKDDLKVFLHFAPINAMWTLDKKIYKYGHKGLTAFKALLYYISWNIKDKKRLYKQLNDVNHIKPFKALRWKHKVCYFMGEMNGKKVFIKTGGEVNTTEREVYALTYAADNSDILKYHIPLIYRSTDRFLIEERIDGKKLTEDDRYVSQLYDIYSEMKKLGILHLDIRPDNFIVKNDGTLILIDFGYALVNSTDIYNKIKKTAAAGGIMKKVGSEYAPKNGTADDAYSMLLTMKYVCPSLLKMYPSVWREMNEDIGERKVDLE